jgi:uncharacterized RDD family membrane protein YckC
MAPFGSIQSLDVVALSARIRRASSQAAKPAMTRQASKNMLGSARAIEVRTIVADSRPDPLLTPAAGLAARIAAMVYDWLLLVALYFCTTLIVVTARRGAALAPGTWWYTALLFVVSFGFYGWFWTHGGQTLGLRAWRLRVERFDGQPLSWTDAAKRFAASAALLVPPGLGLLWMLIDKQSACWHDRLSGTRIARATSRTFQRG